MINTLGRFFLVRSLLVIDIIKMVTLAFRNALRACTQRNVAIKMVLLRQLYFTGLEATYVIVVIAVIIARLGLICPVNGHF
jgi:hypothetical protein